MVTRKTDVLDYNVTLKTLKTVLNTIKKFGGKILEERLLQLLSLGKKILVEEAIGFLLHLNIIKEENGHIVLKEKYNSETDIRPLLLKKLNKIEYIGDFLDEFLKSKGYYDITEFTKILRDARYKCGIIKHEKLNQKVEYLERHLRELGLAITIKNDRKYVVIAIDPSLILEIFMYEHIHGSKYIFEIINVIDKYFPCRHQIGGMIKPLKRVLSILSNYGQIELKNLSDAKFTYKIGEEEANAVLIKNVQHY